MADPSDDRDELNHAIADAVECAWFVGFATCQGALIRGDCRWRAWGDATLTEARVGRHTSLRGSRRWINQIYRSFPSPLTDET